MWARCGIEVIIVVGASFDHLWNWEGLPLKAYTSAFHWEVSKLGLDFTPIFNIIVLY